MSSESGILRVGDLVAIKNTVYAPFYHRGEIFGVGIVLEVEHSAWMGTIYYVQMPDGVWRFSDYELELVNESG